MGIFKPLEQKQRIDNMMSKNGYVRRQQWTAPPAANASLILSGQSLASGGTVTTFAGQPAVPRNVQIVASGSTTAQVTVNGTNIRGQSISETLTLNGTTPVLGAKAFALITSVVLPTVAATTINLGTGVKLGLDRMMAEASIIGEYVDGALEATAAVAFSASNIENNTLTTTTAPNGTHNFSTYFATNEVTELSGTTS